MGQRIKGQEVEVLLIVNGAVKSTLTAVKSFNFNFDLETKSEGFLGETSNRMDSVFNGISGDLEYQFDNRDILDTIAEIVDKARRRVAGVQINIKASLNFPDGTRARIIIPNAEFGAIPVGFAGRTEYGSIRMTYAATDARVIS